LATRTPDHWWPVWVVGLLMAGLTWWEGHRLAIVPAGTQVVEGFDGGREAVPWEPERAKM